MKPKNYFDFGAIKSILTQKAQATTLTTSIYFKNSYPNDLHPVSICGSNKASDSTCGQTVFALSACTAVYDSQRPAVSFVLGCATMVELAIAKNGGIDVAALVSIKGWQT